MGIFDSLREYAAKWQLKSTRPFSADEINSVKNAVVVESQYGSSVCFFMKSGGQKYIPLSTDSTAGIGEEIDLNKAEVLTLGKDGELDINRVRV